MKGRLKGRWDWRVMLPAGIVLVVVYLTLVPILMLIYGSFRDGPPGTESAFNLSNYGTVFTNPNLYNSLANSLRFAFGGGSLAFGIGCLLAWITERTNIPFKGLVYAAVFIELMIPGVLETIALVLLYSPRVGLINVFLMGALSLEAPPFDIYGMGGMIWAFGVGSFAVPFLLMAAAFRSMDPSLEEAAMVSGSGTLGTLYRVTLKLALPAMLATWLLLFIRAIETFEEPLVLGLPSGITVLATEVYLAVRRMPTNYNLAATFATVYLAIAVVGMVIYFRATRFSERYAVITGKGYRSKVIDLGGWRYPVLGIVLFILAVVLFLPLLVIFYASLLPWYAPPSMEMFRIMSLNNYRELLAYEMIGRAFWNNLVVGMGSATLAVFFTAVIAWIVVRTTIPGRRLLDVLAFSPIAYPGIVFGLALMWLYLTVPIPVYGTLWILLIAYVSKYMPLCMRACNASINQVHKELEEASQASGATWWSTFSRIVIPLILPGMLVGWVYVLTLTFKVLSLPILLGRPGTEVVPVLIFEMYEAGEYTQLNALGVVVVVLVTATSLLVRRVSRRFGMEEVR